MRNQIVTTVGVAVLLSLAGCNDNFEAKKTNLCGLKPTGNIDCDTKKGKLDVMLPGNLDASNSGNEMQYKDSAGDSVGQPVQGHRVVAGSGEWVSFDSHDVPAGADSAKVTIHIESKPKPVCFTVVAS